MELSQEDILQIEKYWKKELDEKAIQSFEERMLSDKNFANTVDDLQTIFSGIEDYGEEEMMQKLQTWSEEERQFEKKKETKPVVKQFNLVRWVSAFAAIGLIALAALFLLPKTDADEALYASHFEPYPDLISQRGEVEKSQILNGLRLYNEGNYKAAIPILQSENNKANADPRLSMYLAISYSQVGDHKNAQHYFDKIILSESGNLEYTAHWHKGLDHLKAKDYKNAKAVFHSITQDSQNPFKQKAETILSDQLFQ